MKTALSAATWKRLTFTLALSAAGLLGLIVPASPVNATAVQPACSWNQNKVIVYYSDAAHTHAVCQDIIPCNGQTPPNYCAGSHTPYTTSYCTNGCALN